MCQLKIISKMNKVKKECQGIISMALVFCFTENKNKHNQITPNTSLSSYSVLWLLKWEGNPRKRGYMYTCS